VRLQPLITLSPKWAAQELVVSWFEWMSLMEEPWAIVTMELVSSANIDEIHERLLGLFPDVEFEKLNKKYLLCNNGYPSLERETLL
jgi:hypothetical protein